MNPNTFPLKTVITLTALATLSLAGCQDKGPKNTEYFTQDEVHSIDATLERQAANGARNDGMLRDQHFDADSLNALGRAKLSRILAQPGPATIYLPGQLESPSLASRRQAIYAFAKDHGRPESELKIVEGINPATAHPASPDITRLKKTELGSSDAGASDQQNNSTDLGLSGNNAPAAQGSTPAKTGG